MNLANRETAFFFGGFDFQKPLPNIGILLARIFGGYTMLIAGLDKLPLTDWMVEQVTSMGFPFPVFFAWLATWAEFAFGCLFLLGLLTRFSAIILATVMGVAAFGFHQVIPFGEMHITQGYFWFFLVFAVMGGGKYAFDHYVSQSALSFRQKMLFTGIPALMVLLALGLYLQYSPIQNDSEPTDDFTISSINLAGNFNEWNPTATIMNTEDSLNYFTNLTTEGPLAIQFKFTANESWEYNLGEIDQENKGFPIEGKAELDSGSNTRNIQAYLPQAGIYRIRLNIESFRYSVDSIRVGE